MRAEFMCRKSKTMCSEKQRAEGSIELSRAAGLGDNALWVVTTSNPLYITFDPLLNDHVHFPVININIHLVVIINSLSNNWYI